MDTVRKTLKRLHKGDLSLYSKFENQNYRVFKGQQPNEFFKLRSCLKTPLNSSKHKTKSRIIWVDASRITKTKLGGPQKLSREEISLCRKQPDPTLKEGLKLPAPKLTNIKKINREKENKKSSNSKPKERKFASEKGPVPIWRQESAKNRKKGSKKKKKLIKYFYSPDNSMNRKRIQLEQEQTGGSYMKDKFFFKKRNLYYKP